MTPPTTPSVLTSPATLNDDQVAIAVNGGLHAAVFGPAVGAAAGRVRVGLVEDLELVLDGGALAIAEESIAGEHRGIYTGRAGFKYRLHRHVALIGGVGAGVAPASGVFVGADVGFVAAYENPYFVPYVALRAFYDVPIRPGFVDVGIQGDDAVGDVLVAPSDTLGGSLELGFRAPVGRDRRFNLMLSGVLTALYDGRGGVLSDDDTLWLLGVMSGFEMVIGR